MLEINSIYQSRKVFEDLGFDTLPLQPGTKTPWPRYWTTRKPYQLWRNAPMNCNLGVRAGGDSQIAFLDCDEKNRPGTFERAQNWLARLGYFPGEYPIIKTSSGVGRHIAFRFDGNLAGNARKLNPELGAGEFRYGPGAMVVAPPSHINGGGEYQLIDGDYRQLPKISTKDIINILDRQENTSLQNPKQSMSRHALALLRGYGINKFSSRSEAEQSLISSLINSGHNFESVLWLFQSNQCAGKFSEIYKKSPSNAIGWLRHSYENAFEWTNRHSSKGRQIAQLVINYARSVPWAGRTGSTDRDVFLAHAQIAYQAGKITYVASSRSIAEIAKVSQPTASKSTIRLINKSFICLEASATFDYAAKYSLVQSFSLPKTIICEEVKRNDANHDAFRHRGLGKSAGQIYQCLLNQFLTEKEISTLLGRSLKTVRRNLNKMAYITDRKTGEVLYMVIKANQTWRALPVDLNQIARIFGTYQKSDQQKRQHTNERNEYRRSLEKYKCNSATN